MKKAFLITSILLIAFTFIASFFFPKTLFLLIIILPVIILGIYDLSQKKHAILRNFPVLGHFRYFFEFVAPELHQYFVESDIDGRPFSRLQRNFVYKRAKLTLETHPFGTELNVYEPGYMWMAHSIFPKEVLAEIPRIKFGGGQCTQPYEASIFNISAMSFGALGKNAIRALNKGAKLGGFFHNTGEGGLSPYHLENGGDLVWQIGTAYFGCRDSEGNFSEKYFAETARLKNVKMIELKISQGAKPGLGGILPAEKNTPEIAAIRRLTPYKMVHSPSAHQVFSDPEGLLNFMKKLRDLSGGKPVGFKLCIGSRQEFINICEAMVTTGIRPDFITIDGGEGGTGAGPIEFSDSVGMPLQDALLFTSDTLNGYDLKKEIRIIASCKVVSGFDIVRNLCIGADTCNSARGMMFALGCIQALKCDTNECPTGIATQDARLEAGLVVGDKAVRISNFHNETVKAAMGMLTAAGLDDLTKLNRSYIYKRVDQKNAFTIEHLYPSVSPGAYLDQNGKIKAKGEQERHHKQGQPERSSKPVDPQKGGHDFPSEEKK